MMMWLLYIYFGSIVGIIIQFRVQKKIQGAYISGTEILWMFVFFCPLLNTLFFILLCSLPFMHMYFERKHRLKLEGIINKLRADTVYNVDDPTDLNGAVIVWWLRESIAYRPTMHFEKCGISLHESNATLVKKLDALTTNEVGFYAFIDSPRGREFIDNHHDVCKEWMANTMYGI
jgi:hypothetical protein